MLNLRSLYNWREVECAPGRQRTRCADLEHQRGGQGSPAEGDEIVKG